MLLPPLQPPRVLVPHRAGPWSEDMCEEMFEDSKMNDGMFSIETSALNRSVRRILKWDDLQSVASVKEEAKLFD